MLGIGDHHRQREVTITFFGRSNIQAREVNVQAIGLCVGIISELRAIRLPAVQTIGGTEQVEVTDDFIIGLAFNVDVTQVGVGLNRGDTLLGNHCGVVVLLGCPVISGVIEG